MDNVSTVFLQAFCKSLQNHSEDLGRLGRCGEIIIVVPMGSMKLAAIGREWGLVRTKQAKYVQSPLYVCEAIPFDCANACSPLSI